MDTYEKKYKEALANARQEYNTTENVERKQWLEELFPELIESDDERIRKELISFLQLPHPQFVGERKQEKWLAWLEKQEGCECIKKDWLEHIKQSWYKEGFIDGKYTPKKWTINDTTTLNELIDFFENGTAKLQHDITKYANWLKIQFTPIEKQSEQKLANKVEPKFKVGDWITDGEAVFHITSYSIDYGYQLETPKGTSFHFSNENVENKYHLWTIQDAKDGDVLVDEDVNVIGIFEGIEGMCWHSKFYYSSTTKEFYGIECGGSHQKDFAKPATKEQRDLLFQKMKEAGYEWDAEKKELKIKLKEPDVYEYELERVVDKPNEVIGKLGDIYEVLSNHFQFPYMDYTPPSPVPGMDVWYKTHGVDKVPPVTCETIDGLNKSKDNESN